MELTYAKKIFLIAKQAENVSGRTIKTYIEVISDLFNFLGTVEITDIVKVDDSCIREYMLSLQHRGLRGITQLKHFGTLRPFFRFLHENDYIQTNPISKVKPPKKEKYIMRTFTAQEISKLLNAFDKTTFIGLRNYCIFCMFFSTGMRNAELLKLTLADINITNDLIRIIGKGKKERFVPIGRSMRKTLIHYLKKREEFLDGEVSPYLFISTRNTRIMTYSCLNDLFRRLKKELNITGEKVSSHTFRHTFSKNYLLNGGDVFSLQKCLGHSDIATTKNYLNLNDGELQTQHAKYNPLDNKGWM
jgi:site-specific recombinase XerD